MRRLKGGVRGSLVATSADCELRTCPRSLRGNMSRTHDPPVESYRLNQCATTSHLLNEVDHVLHVYTIYRQEHHSHNLPTRCTSSPPPPPLPGHSTRCGPRSIAPTTATPCHSACTIN